MQKGKVLDVSLTLAVHILALLPLLLLALDYWQGGLGANPIQEVQLCTGIYAMVLLTASLAWTPLYTLTGIPALARFRRTVGLYAFFYASLHFLNLIGLDYLFNFSALWKDLADKRYILAGFPAWLLLLVLAITSTNGFRRRLGKNWRRVHRFVYVAGVLAVIHYFWQVKVEVPGPLIYAGILAFLLLLRLPPIERLVHRLPWRRRPIKAV